MVRSDVECQIYPWKEVLAIWKGWSHHRGPMLARRDSDLCSDTSCECQPMSDDDGGDSDGDCSCASSEYELELDSWNRIAAQRMGLK